MRRVLGRLGPVAICLSAPLWACAGALAYVTATGNGSAQASVATITGASNVIAQQNGSSVAISWSSATLSTGAAVQGYRVSRSDGTIVCGSPTPVTALQCMDASPPAGSYSYTVTAVYNSWDASATSAAITMLTAPTLGSTPIGTSASGSASFTFSGGGTGVSYQCQLDGGGFSACTSPKAYSSLADGSHTFQVRAALAGSSGPSTSYTWTINTAAPTIASQPAATSANPSPSFGFSDGAYTSFKCRRDGGTFSACTSPKAYTSLTDGSHTFQVEALDANGIATAVASYTWTINTAAPTITTPPANPSFSASASIGFSDSAYTSFKCQLDGGGFSACSSPASYTALAGGSHTFQVEAVGADGVATAVASSTWKTGIFFRSASTAKTTTSFTSSLTIAAPTGIVAGDLMIAIVADSDTSVSHLPAAPTGWTQIRGVVSGQGGFAAFSHVATASEPTSYVFTNAASTALAGAIDVYGGQSTSAPIQTSASSTGGGLFTNPLAPSITTTVAHERVLVATGYGRGGNPDTVSNTITDRGSASATGGPLGASTTEHGADFDQTSAGATPTEQFTLNGGSSGNSTINWATMTIALNPA